MPNMYMTRTDDITGVENTFDSINWIYETHLKMPDTGEYNFAILIGPNEDYVTEILLWRKEPNFDQKPDRHYKLYIGENEEMTWQLQG